MADYNIYIHSFGNYDSPTTPFQVREESDTSGVGGEGGSGGGGFGAIRRAASFVSNPDSALGAVMNTASGAIRTAAKALGPVGIITILFGAAIKIASKVDEMYMSYASPASGDFRRLYQYENTKQAIHMLTHPFSTEIQRQKAQLQIKMQNAKNEQEMLLTGGTIYNSKYGRYL